MRILLSLLLFAVCLAGCNRTTSPEPSSSPVETPEKRVEPTPDEPGEWAWRVFISRPGIIDTARVSTTGQVDSLTTSKFDQMGPPTERLVMEGDKAFFQEEQTGIQFQFFATTKGHLLASEGYNSTLFSIPLDKGLPSRLEPTEMAPIVMECAEAPKTNSFYISEGASNSIVRFQMNETGKLHPGATYRTNASLPGIAMDPESETLWVAEGKLTSFELKTDPDLKKPKTVLEGRYKDVTFVSGPKLLVLEIEVEGELLPDKAFEIYSLGGEGLKKLGLVQPQPDAYAYGFTDDGKWMLVGGSHGDKKLRSYRLEEGKITLVDTLPIGSGSDQLDVRGNLVLIDRRDSTILVSLAENGKLALRQTFPGSGAIMSPLE